MNWIDIGLLILAGGGGILGYLSGIINQIGRIIAVVCAVYAAIYFHLPVTDWLEPRIYKPFAGIASYVIIFVLAYLGFLLLLHAIDRALEDTELKKYDRTIGGVFGVLKGVIIAGFLLLGLAMYPNRTVREDIQESITGKPLLSVTHEIAVLIPREATDSLEETFDTSEEKTEKSVKEEIHEDVREDTGISSSRRSTSRPNRSPEQNQAYHMDDSSRE